LAIADLHWYMVYSARIVHFFTVCTVYIHTHGPICMQAIYIAASPPEIFVGQAYLAYDAHLSQFLKLLLISAPLF